MITNEAEAQGWVEGLPEWNALAGSRLERLTAMLIEENTRQNLVSTASLGEIWRRHIADSAQLLSYVSRETCSPWLDLGTGAGFPGLVIAILRPELEIVMVESRNRRIDWLNQVIEALDLEYASVAGMPIERLQSRSVGVISARAFAPLDRLLDLSARFSTEQTCWLLPKGRSAQQELQNLKGWNHLFYVEQSLTDREAGVVTGRLIGRKGRKSR